MVTRFNDLMTYNGLAQYYQERIGRKFNCDGEHYILLDVINRGGVHSNKIRLKVLCLEKKEVNISVDIKHLSTELFKFEYDRKYDINTIEVLYGKKLL